MPSEHVDNSRVTVVCNAQKRVAVAQRLVDALKQHGLDVSLVVTGSADDAGRAARDALDAGTRILVAAGGDGTVRSLIGPVTEADAVLGLLPLGTSNDLALDLGVRTLKDAIATVVGARARPWDLGACSYRNLRGEDERGFFCSTAGVGVIARALAMAERGFGSVLKRTLGNGVWPPLVTASTCVTRALPQTLRVNDVALERSLKLLEISKLRSIGGIPITPDARGDSGMLHAWTVNAPGAFSTAQILYQALSGSMRHLKHEHVEYFSREPSQNRAGVCRVTQIAVEGGEPMPVHVNGDYVGTTPATFELTARTFRVLAPAELATEGVRVKQERARALRHSIPVPTSPRAARSA